MANQLLGVDSLEKMPRYEAYKDSEVDFLGVIPESWGVKKLKFLGDIYAGLVGKKGDDFSKEPKKNFLPFVPFTSISISSIVTNRYQYVLVRKSELQAIVINKDILFLMSSETLEDIAKCALYTGSEWPLYLNSFCKGFRIKADKAQPEYINYLLQSNYYREYFGMVARGFTRINLKQEYINGVKVLIPKKKEQTAIINFLDCKTSQIDQAIAIKEKQIALLKERKQILIQNAITRGLDPNVSMKDSGVEWLGSIPEHWQCKRLKYVVKILKRIIGYEGPDVLSITQQGIKVKDIKSGEGQLSMDYSKYQIVYSGEFAMNHMDLLTGYVDISSFDGVTSPDYRVFVNVLREMTDKYLLLIFQVGYKHRIFYRYGQGVSLLGRWRFPADNFNNFFIPIPPEDEQMEIVRFIDTESIKIENTVTLLQAQIKKLKEYKSTLINSAVTGKIKVT